MCTLRARYQVRTARSMSRLLTIHDLRQMFRLGRTAAYRLTTAPGFPPPKPISRSCYRWEAEAVEAFLAAMGPEQPLADRPAQALAAANDATIVGRTRTRRARIEGAA